MDEPLPFPERLPKNPLTAFLRKSKPKNPKEIENDAKRMDKEAELNRFNDIFNRK
tara:strand:- start:171 stop:335 length:165 start_codon:yes stop_codon:yes gene_type:complete